MAEIKIEKKKPVWPWIIIILIILAAIYFFWYYNDRGFEANDDLLQNDTISQMEETGGSNNQDTDSSILYTGSYGTVKDEHDLSDYLKFVDRIDNKTSDENYYRTAFFKLITATKREAEIKKVDVDANIASAMKHAEMLTNDPAITTKSDEASAAAEQVSQALVSIQQQAFSGLSEEANAVKTAAQGIDRSGEMKEQSGNLDVFFDKSAVLLHKMYEDESEPQ